MGRNTLHFEGELCEECGVNPKRKKGYTLKGTQRYDKVCRLCHRINTSGPWLKYRGESCEECGYTPMFTRSLDVHHRDGDKTNNDPSNLKTVCATCHRELEALIFDLDGNWKKAESLFKKFIKALIS